MGPVTGQRRGRRPGRSTTRHEILLATAEIVADEGIDRATVRRIPARAGVDPALIYRHFESKSALLEAVFARTILKRVAELARPDHRELRAALIGAQIIGAMIVRLQVRIPALATAGREDVVRAVAPVVQHYLTGDLGLPDEPPRRSRRVS